MAKPGAISRAHRGVLFMDEAPEFTTRVIDSLRTPLESGYVSIGRSEVQTRYPARFQLVLASNPCPCGFAATAGARCECSPMAIRRYRERLSGPIKDRIDIQLRLLPMKKALLKRALARTESSATVAGRVAEARRRQERRLRGTGWQTNGDIPGTYLRRHLPLPAGTDLVDRAFERGWLSSRGVDKVLKLSWTLADLAGLARPGEGEIRTALAMRRGDVDELGAGVTRHEPLTAVEAG